MTMFARPAAPGAAISAGVPNVPAAASPNNKPAKRPRAWALSNWPVGSKVLAIVLVPLLLATIFGGLRVEGAMASASSLRLAAARADVIPAITKYMSALDVALLASSTGRDVEGARKNYDARKYELQTRLADTDVIPDVRSGVSTLLNGGQALLDKVLANSISLRDRVTTYAPILLTAENVINASVRIDSEQIRAQAQGLSRAVGARGQMTMQEILVTRGADLPEPELRTSMITLAGTEPSTLFGMSEVLGAGSPEAKTLQQQMVTRMAIMSDPASALVDNSDLLQSVHTTDGIAEQVINDATASVTKSLQTQATARREAAMRDTGLMLAAILIALGIVLVVARALVRPLRVLRDGALKVAHTDLEDEITRIRAGGEPVAAPGGLHHRGNRPGSPRRGRTARPGPAAGRRRGAVAVAGQRHVRDHVAAQPFTGRPAAVAHRPAGAQRGGSRPPRQLVPAGSLGGPAAPQQRQPVGAGRRAALA